MNITGRIANKQYISGTLKKSSAICGKIDKPSGHTPVIDGDHQFITVDLVKMQEQIASVSSVTAIVPFTAENTQITGSRFYFNAVPAVVAVNPITANNISLSAVNITVNEEVCTNANQ